MSAKSNYETAPYGMKNKTKQNKKTKPTTTTKTKNNNVLQLNSDLFFFRTSQTNELTKSTPMSIPTPRRYNILQAINERVDIFVFECDMV